MDIQNAITILKQGKLAQLKVKDDPDAVLGFINQGILDLHKRFNLLYRQLDITVVEGTTIYTFDGSDTNVPIDLTDEQLLKITEIADEDDINMPINDRQAPLVILTPRYDQLHIPEAEEATLTVWYKAAPLFLTNVKQTIPLPPQLLDPLFAYAAWKGHETVHQNNPPDQVHNPFYKKYLAACKEISDQGLDVIDNLDYSKLTDRGFV